MVEKSTVVATVAPSASLLVMTLPPVFISPEYSSTEVFWQTKLDDLGSARCHKNDVPRDAVSSMVRKFAARI
jgi:hypothetical protein